MQPEGVVSAASASTPFLLEDFPAQCHSLPIIGKNKIMDLLKKDDMEKGLSLV